MKTQYKLYKVILRGMTSNSTGVAYGTAYAIAENSDQAYQMVRKHLDKESLGFSKDREFSTVELIAENSRYTDTGHILYLPKEIDVLAQE